MDEDYARMIVDREEAAAAAGIAEDGMPTGADPREPTPLGYNPELSYLAIIADRTLLVRDAVIASGGEDPPHSQPLPRPTTAVERERARRNRDELLEIDRMLRGAGLPMT